MYYRETSYVMHVIVHENQSLNIYRQREYSFKNLLLPNPRKEKNSEVKKRRGQIF